MKQSMKLSRAANGLAAGDCSPHSLPGFDSAGTGAVLSDSPSAGIFSIDDRTAAGDACSLLDDYIPCVPNGAVSAHFSGLTNGQDDVITPAWMPAAQSRTSRVFIGDELDGTSQLAGGQWTGTLALGVTHALHLVQVIDGTMTVSMTGSTSSTGGVLDGIQLIDATPPAGDVNGDGVVNTLDLGILLDQWTMEPGHGCDGFGGARGSEDLNHDYFIDSLDQGILLSGWTLQDPAE